MRSPGCRRYREYGPAQPVSNNVGERRTRLFSQNTPVSLTHANPPHALPHASPRKNIAWGCVGMRGDGPHTKFVFFPSPWKKSQRLLDVSVRPHGKFDLGIHPHAKFEVEFRLTPTSVPVPTQNLALVSVPTQTSDVGTRPHAKFRPPVGQ